MKINFVKMQGLGNDFVVIDTTTNSYESSDLASIAAKLCDRHFGIGGDGMILMEKSEKADFKMRMFNPDGSEAEMCGNGIRCLAEYVSDHNLTDKNSLVIETLAGLIKVEKLNGQIMVGMGKPKLLGEKDHRLSVDNYGDVNITVISMGNPHAVVFVDSLEDFPVGDLGPKIEEHNFFPNRCQNTHP